jgi:hypothetical protein
MGFVDRTQRAAWRHEDGNVEVVEVATVGAASESVGAPPASFSVFVASVPAWLPPPPGVGTRGGRLAPHYWQTPLSRRLAKTLPQPWFRPFSAPVAGGLPPSFALHRAGLRSVIRSDVHDRRDTWFVRDDGSNLDEVLDDLSAVLLRDGLPALAAFRDPAAVTRMVAAGELRFSETTPIGRDLIAEAKRHLGEPS